MVNTIFFDFDGVLTLQDRGSTDTINGIQEANPEISLETIQTCYYKFHNILLQGTKNHSDIWDDFCSCIGKKIAKEVLFSAFSKTQVNVQTHELALKLAKKYRVGIITDNALDRMQFLINKFKLDELFDPIIISAEIGKQKDSSEIFKRALALCQCKAEECIFIDNYEKNLTIPAQLGFKTFLFNMHLSGIGGLEEQLMLWGVGE